MKAGFDLSDISVQKWHEGLVQFRLSCVTKQHDLEKNGWVWYDPVTNNRVVTSNNPISGEHIVHKRPPEMGYCAYMGIEGTDEFVKEFFDWFNLNADYIKDEEFGKRTYI